MHRPRARSLGLSILILAVLSVLAITVPQACAQNTNGRYDNFAWTSTTIAGQQTFTSVPYASVQVCNYPANAVPCTNLVTLYLGPTTTGGTAPNPLATDLYGNFGFWAPSGTYQYTLTTSTGQSVGPYSLVLGTGSGGGGGSPGGTLFSIQYNNSTFAGASISGLVKASTSGAPVAAVANSDYLLPTGPGTGLTGIPYLTANTFTGVQTAPQFIASGSMTTPAITVSGLTPGNCVQVGSGGILTAASGACASSSGGATTPATTNLLKGNGAVNGVLAATPGTDYVIPSGSISGTAANLSGTPTLPNGTSGTTQSATDTSTLLATDSFVHTVAASQAAVSIPSTANLLKGAGSAGASLASLFTDNATTGGYTGTGGFSAVSFNSTDTVNNTSVSFQTGSGGDSTCPTPVSGTSFICTKSSGISFSINGAAYGPIGGASTPATSNLLKGSGSANGVIAGSPGTDYIYPFMFNGMGSQGQATSSMNFGSNQFQLTGSCWDGTTHQNDFYASGSVPAANGTGALMLNVWNHYGGCNTSALGIFTYPISMGNGLSAFNVDAKYFGAYGDAFSPIDGCITSNSSNVLNCNGPFISTQVDGGKDVWVHGAGAAGVAFHSTIVSVTDANHAVMAATPSISLTNTPGNTVYGHDDTAKIQACFQFSANNSLPCALIPAQNPPGQGLQGFLVGSAGLQLVSASSGGEVSATNFYGSSQVHGTNIFCEFNGDCLSEAAGRIQGANISNIEFLGDPTQPNGRGMHFVAAPGIFGDGGLWQSNITNVNVESFTQECLLSEAGGGPGYGFNLPFQIDNFYQFFCQAPNQMHTANLIKMVGQTAQIAFFGGQANGPGSEANQPNAMILITEKTSGLSDTPTDVKFFGYTYEVGTIGLQLGEGAYNIHYDNSYVENVATPLIAGGTGGVYGLTYNGNHMANSGNGTAVAQFTGGVTGSMRDNLVYGGTTPGAFAICTNTGNQIDFGSGNNSSVNTITGCTPTIAVSAAGSPLAANTCTSASTATVTGVYTTARVDVTFSGDPTAITGWGATGGMVIDAWPSAKDTVSYKLCNQTPSPITYGAITFNVDFK